MAVRRLHRAKGPVPSNLATFAAPGADGGAVASEPPPTAADPADPMAVFRAGLAAPPPAATAAPVAAQVQVVTPKPRRAPKKPEPSTATSPEKLLDTMSLVTPEGTRALTTQERALEWPDHGYIESRAMERTQLYGGTGPASPVAWDIPTTYDGIVLAVRARRKGQVKPAIPASYQKTAKDVRAGQSLIDDAVSIVASTLCNGERRFTMIQDDATQDEADRATKLERVVNALILGGKGRPGRFEQECGEPWIDLGIEQACSDGKGIWEVADRKELWSIAHGFPDGQDYDDDQTENEDGTPSAIPADQRKTGRQKFLKASERFTKHAPLPFQVGRVDPLNFCEWKQNGKAFEAIKIEMRSVREVYPLYGLWRDGSDFTGTAYQRSSQTNGRQVVGEPYPTQQMPPITGQLQARCVTFWHAEPDLQNEKGEVPVLWVYEVDGCRVAKGSTIGPLWHPLPFFPFNGMHTSLPDPAFQGVSFAFRMLRLCDAIDTLLSMKLNVAALVSMPSWTWTKPENGQFDINTGGAGAAAASGITIASSSASGTSNFQTGVMYHLGPGESIQPLSPPQGATAILDSLKADLLELINLVGLPAAIRGLSPGSGSAGYMVAQLIAAARTKLAPILNNASSALVSLIQYVLWQIEHCYSEGIPVQAGSDWLTVKPSDIDGRYLCELTITPLLPVDQLQEEDHSLKLWEAGAISMKRLREESMGLLSSSEEQEQIEAERLGQNKLIALPRALVAAVRLGTITPEEARAIKAKEFGIPYNSPAAAVGGVLLGPDGQPMMPSGATQPPPPLPGMEGLPPQLPQSPAGAAPGVPGVPGTPPIMPPMPDVNGPVAASQLAGGVGIPHVTPLPPNRAAAAVSS